MKALIIYDTFMVSLFGYAAKPIATRLQKKGGELVVPPEGFIVNGKEGPLKEGERARAALWATACCDNHHHAGYGVIIPLVARRCDAGNCV